jgi:DNA invertase Pin-like site-specific DNA recombinase
MTQRRRTAPTASPRTAVAYLRVSTDEQHLGPDAQRAAITAWATREGVSVVAWHVDAGVSGAAAIADRPELLAALAALREHGAGILAVAKRDRLARDVMAAAMIERMADDAGARVVSAAGEGTDSDDPSAVLMRRMVDAFAEYERALIAARTRAALAVKRSRGEATSHAPFGFRAVVGGVLVADEAEQAVIAQVRAARARGLTVRAICDELRAAGIVSRKGKPLAVSAVGELVVAHA